MNVNSLSHIGSYLESVVSNTISGVTGASAASSTSSASGSSGASSVDQSLPQDGNPQLSPFAQVLSTLQQLQQSNPSEYQQVTSQIATNLQNASQTATSAGNTSQASELSQLASDFSNASQNNTLPNIQDLAQAIGAGHGHHHQYGHSSDASSSSSATSGTSSNATSPGTPDSMLTQLISMFFGSSNSATPTSTSNSLDPLSIINSTLTSAGV